MKKLILIFISMVLLCSCNRAKKDILRIQVYTVDECGACLLVRNTLGTLEEEHDEIYVTYLDLDEEKNQLSYQKLNLQENKVPTIIVGKAFIKQGYSIKDKKVFKQNVLKALNHKKITYDQDYLRIPDN